METRDPALVVMTFEDETEARSVASSLRTLEKAGRLSIEDTAIIRRGMDGKIHVDNQVDSAVKQGAVVGGFLGMFIGWIFFPVGGLLMGVAGGAIVGKMLGDGVDKTFVKDVTESLQPGTSALFVMARGGDPAAVVAALRPYKGTVYHTTLSSEAEETLRKALAE